MTLLSHRVTILWKHQLAARCNSLHDRSFNSVYGGDIRVLKLLCKCGCKRRSVESRRWMGLLLTRVFNDLMDERGCTKYFCSVPLYLLQLWFMNKLYGEVPGFWRNDVIFCLINSFIGESLKQLEEINTSYTVLSGVTQKLIKRYESLMVYFKFHTI